MTRTSNGKAPLPGGTDLPEGTGPISTGPINADLPEGAGPIDTGTPVRGPESGVEDGPHPGRPLFAPAEQEAFAVRIQQAVTGFVEDPHRAVREADATFDEVVASLGKALEERGRRLRAGRSGSGPTTGAETEDLRIALQHYRDLTERLVRL
ncbi:hypothetical protein ACH4MN_30240 [Streptomyces anulatus]|uniref:hypothetical protein n=1 Tax=Streptomyces TaxID=1883 RepID=UPI0008518985|nr:MULTISPECIES: hypothetical protein [unclassified Streptomyces]MBQ1106952.1 hypothetical protein [Streptomyces sp. 404i]MBQ1113024.1 hypothetical protein [Streptomyces sp. C3-3]MDQ0700625.1 hypothetical protein [Streptomyces sp. W4I9-2]MDX3486582.1 hypothetical protein [Streptomyces sp. ID05-18]